MNYIKSIRDAYCLKQSELGQFLQIERNHLSMIEIEKRRLTPYQLQRIECLQSQLIKAQNEPPEKLLKPLDEQVNAEVYRTLVLHAMELEEEINSWEEKMLLLHDQHQLLKTRFLALQMLQHNLENYSWFTDENRSWLNIQLREAQRDFAQSKLSEIHKIDIRIKGLYTQMDHARYLLQSGKPS